jgi:hypothetical protein
MIYFLNSQIAPGSAKRNTGNSTKKFANRRTHDIECNRPRANYKRKKCNLRPRDLGYIRNAPRIYFASSYERKINKYTGPFLIVFSTLFILSLSEPDQKDDVTPLDDESNTDSCSEIAFYLFSTLRSYLGTLVCSTCTVFFWRAARKCFDFRLSQAYIAC